METKLFRTHRHSDQAREACAWRNLLNNGRCLGKLGMTLVLTALLLAAMSCEKEADDGDGNGQDTALAAPGGLTATTDSAARSATLSWDAVDEAKNYGLVFAGDTLAVDGTAYTAPNLDYNTTYTWQVRAQSGARLSEWTAGDAFELKGPAESSVPAPTGLTHTLSSPAGNTAVLSWDEVEGADRYDVRIDGKATNSPTNQLAYPIKRLKEYTWQVRAVKGGVPGEWSAEATFTFGEAPVPVPTGLQKQLEGRTSATLTWETSPEADDYQIIVKVTNATVATAHRYTTHAGWWTIPLEEETAYTWQVRARKGDRYSEWSAEQYFLISDTPLVELLIGNWTAHNAVITGRFGNGENNEMELDGLLGRSHPTGDVTVSVAPGEKLTLTGMDNYITGGAIPAGFNIDGQLVDLPLISDDVTGTVSATVDITSNNVYTQSMNVKIGDITFLQPFVATLPTCFKVLFFCINVQNEIKKKHITKVAMRVKKVTVTGSLSGANSASWNLEYEIEVTEIETDIDATILGYAEISEADLPGKIPTPQLLLSTVETTK